MIQNRFISWWLAFSVFYCATFVQVHEIEHIPELLHSAHAPHLSFIDQSNIHKSPIEQAVDQCEICIHGSALEHATLFDCDVNVLGKLAANSRKILQGYTVYNHTTWSSILPRAPPAFLFS